MNIFFRYLSLLFISSGEISFSFGNCANLTVSVEIPENAILNSTVPFHCFFTQAGTKQNISHIEWYRENRQKEFIVRYYPSTSTSTQNNAICNPCLLSMNQFNETQVMTITMNVSKGSSGIYECLVVTGSGNATNTGEATSTVKMNLREIGELPKPKITVENGGLNSQESLTFVCPTVRLTGKSYTNVFFVNNEPINPELSTYDKGNGTLRFDINKTSWKNETNVKVSCRSVLPDGVNWASAEISYNCLKNSGPRLINPFKNLRHSVSISSLLWMLLKFLN